MSNNKPKTNYKPGPQDVMQTPPHALEPLYPLLDKSMIYWEPAAGPEQLIVKAMTAQGYHIRGTDISYDPEYDVFTYAHTMDGSLHKWDAAITNPPWSNKYDWFELFFSLGKPFALLVPYETTAAAEFKKLAVMYHNKPWPINKLEIERRLSFKTPNYGWGMKVWDEKKGKLVMKGDSAQMPTAWITWGLGNPGDYYPSHYNTYDVPMRIAKYNNEDNSERTR
jgi:hypothetical protein